MDKRKRDASLSNTPTLVFAAPGHKRFAKLLSGKHPFDTVLERLFTYVEQSLDEVKLVVQKRMNFHSTAHFALYYNTDIALENDDDFEAFFVHAAAASTPIDVLIEIKQPPLVSPPSVIDDRTAVDPEPPLKKRKVDDGALPSATLYVEPAVVEPVVPVVAAGKPKTTKPASKAAKPKKSKLGDALAAEAAQLEPASVVEGETAVVVVKPKKAAAKKKTGAAAPAEDVSMPAVDPAQTKGKANTPAPNAAAEGASEPVPAAKPRKPKAKPAAPDMQSASEPPATAPKRKGKTPAPDATEGAPEKPKKTKKKKADNENPAAEAKPARKTTKKAAEGDLPGADSAFLSFQEQLAHAITADGEKKSTAKTTKAAAKKPAAEEPSTEAMAALKAKYSPETTNAVNGVSGASKNVIAPPILRPEPTRVSDAPADLNTAAAGGDEDEDTSDDSDSATPRPRPLLARPFLPPPRPTTAPAVDDELEAIMRGPSLSARDIGRMMEEDESEEKAESVVLEQDDEDEDDMKFRRRSRQIHAALGSSDSDGHVRHIRPSRGGPVLSSDDEDDSDKEETTRPLPAPTLVRSALANDDGEPPVPDSPSARSHTEPLFMIDTYQTQHQVDSAGDLAVVEAMARDAVQFGLGKTLSASEGTAVGSGEDDPILPAEDFPSSPIPGYERSSSQPQVPSSPTVGKGKKKLSELQPPIKISPKPKTVAAQEDNEEDEAEEMKEPTSPPTARTTRKRTAVAVESAEDARPAKRMTRQKTAELQSQSQSQSQPEPPATQPRRRGPAKTPEQRQLEAQVKAAAKEERERVKKENALAKAATKKGVKKPPSKSAAAVKVAPVDPREQTQESQVQWEILPGVASSYEGGDDGNVEGFQRDELRSSSPKDARSDDDSEEEIAQLVKSSQPPPQTQPKEAKYRRLTDIASQPAMYTPPSTNRAMRVPATLPKTKVNRAKARNEMYGALGGMSEESGDEEKEEQSHIPLSRRAGTKK
ncbi:Carbamoyl-phosphate synthase [Mycena chlorophos]|uniref:Carbamoyl-phosphate synthase n=1 Tax=Mycena chlorophos TaxID=658473 RepID=A0A8H6SVR3_MYCCL|nr:Carbamoyl-phosphate synthase [Mycena chlorophos]